MSNNTYMKPIRIVTFSVLLFALLGMSSCKKAPSSTAKKPLYEQLGIKNTDFDFFEARGKLTYEDDEQRLKSSAIIRMAKDSLIWVSLRPALGIEALRVLIRPDSAFMIDRLHNEYMAYDIEGLSQKLNFDLDFGLLQAMILGNTLPLEGDFDDPITGEEVFLVTQRAAPFEVESQISRRNRKLLRLNVNDTLSSNRMQVAYEDFRSLDKNRTLPHKSFGQVEYTYKGARKTSSLETVWQRISFPTEALSFPFTVPDKFKQK